MASSAGRTLISLPTEILVLIFYQASTIGDACALSQTCLRLHKLLSRDKDKIDIFRTVANVPNCPKFDPGENPVLVRPSSTTWAFPSSIDPKRGLFVEIDHWDLDDWEIKTSFFDLAIHVKRLKPDEAYWNGVLEFLIQFVQLKHRLTEYFENYTEELLSLAASAQMDTIYDLNVELPSPVDLHHERTIIALALQFLAVAHDFSSFEDRSAESAESTEEELFAIEGPDHRVVLPCDYPPGSLYPITLVRQESKQEWGKVRQQHGVRPAYAHDADPGPMLEYIVQTSFRMLDTWDPRHEPTVLYVLLILCMGLLEMDVTAPWLESVSCAQGPLYSLFEDLARYYFICTKGAPIMSDRWDIVEFPDRVCSDHLAAKNAHHLHEHWLKIDKGRWAHRRSSGEPVDDFIIKLKYFAYNYILRPD
ncbi:hypothetical protein BJX62DRAFT_86410 [Aspergillus germanicus]